MNSRRATIIYNPMSGRPARRADDVRRMIRLLGERGIVADARATAQPQDATVLAREAVAGRVDIVVSYGGDGTLNEVIQEMAGSRTALAVWPGGTSNVVARDLGVPFDVVELADMITAGNTLRIALGVAKRGSGFGVPSSGLRVQGSELDLKGSAIDAVSERPKSGRLNHGPESRNPELETLNNEPGTLNPEFGTLNPEPVIGRRYFIMM